MREFTCTCTWRFIVGKKRVFGPVFEMGLPGHFSGRTGCYHVGHMMSREEFEDEYADCAYRFRQGMGVIK